MILQEIKANKKRLKDLKDVHTVEVHCKDKQKEQSAVAKCEEGNIEWCRIQVSLFLCVVL